MIRKNPLDDRVSRLEEGQAAPSGQPECSSVIIISHDGKYSLVGDKWLRLDTPIEPHHRIDSDGAIRSWPGESSFNAVIVLPYNGDGPPPPYDNEGAEL